MIEPRGMSDLACELSSLFGLLKQGKTLVSFTAETMDCRHVGLVFRDPDRQDLTTLAYLPASRANPFSSMRIRQRNSVLDHARKHSNPSDKRNIFTNLEIESAFEINGRAFSADKLALAAPLVSRKHLIGILLLGEKRSGSYSPEDSELLQDIAGCAASIMGKEYRHEQTSKRAGALSVINRSSAVMASSLDIQAIFDSFVSELRKIIAVDWAAVKLIDGNDLCVIAVSSGPGPVWKIGEHLPFKGTATEWVANHKQVVFEPDLSQKNRFLTPESHVKRGIRSIAHAPLQKSGVVIGSLVVASRRTNAYRRRQIALLKEVASHVAICVNNSRLFAEVEEKARIDGLTGLFNRRSLDEAVAIEVNRHFRYGGVFSLIMFDFDGALTTANNTYGHLAGDELLRQISVIIRNTLRSYDQAFRYGGDEFIVLLPNTSIQAAVKLADRLRKQLTSGLKADPKPVTASIGVASWPANGKEPEQLIAAADAALYEAKRNGGNQSRLALTSNS